MAGCRKFPARAREGRGVAGAAGRDRGAAVDLAAAGNRVREMLSSCL